MQIKLTFYLNGFSRRFVLKQRQRVTRNWPIGVPTYRSPVFSLVRHSLEALNSGTFALSRLKKNLNKY